MPLIISRPGLTAVGTSDRIVQTGVDLIPTLCDYAGIPIPENLPGTSLKATANGLDAKDSREFVVVSNQMVQGAKVDGVTPQPEGRMLRSRRYKYCVYNLGEQRESLVDMQNDPGEMVNLAEDEQHRGVLNQHRRYLVDWCRANQDGFISCIPEGR